MISLNKIKRLLIGDSFVDQFVIFLAIIIYASIKYGLLILGKKQRDKIFGNKYITIRSFLIKNICVNLDGQKFYVRKYYEDFFIILSLEEQFFELSKNILKKGDTFVDVGCNIGKYSIIMSKHVGSAGRVYSIDADSENILALKKNIALNGLTNIKIIDKAVSTIEKIGQFYQTRWSGMGSLESTLKNSKAITVQITTLDNILQSVERISLMKIDVEGEEANVLLGARSILTKTDNIIIECHSTKLKIEVEKILESQFSIEEIGSNTEERSWLICKRQI